MNEDRPPAEPQDPIASLDEAEGLVREASAARLRWIAEIDERGMWREDGATSTSAWLAARYARTRSVTREWVRVGKALRSLPAIRAAHAVGRLAWDQLRPLTRFAAPEDDEVWSRRAPEMTPAELWREARRREAIRTVGAEDDRQLRHLRLAWDEERRFLHLDGLLAAEQGAAVEAALARRAEEVVLEDAQLYDPGGARLADALEELITGAGGHSPAATLVVHADAEVLAGTSRGGPRLAETGGGVRLSDEATRRLACDARIEWVLESAGRPVGIGRRGRAIPGWLSRLLRHRDAGCRFPGCGRRRWLKAHHLWHWADGGPTDLENLVLLCQAHHRLLHEGGWRVSGHPSTRLTFHRPNGRPLRVVRPPPVPATRAGPGRVTPGPRGG